MKVLFHSGSQTFYACIWFHLNTLRVTPFKGSFETPKEAHGSLDHTLRPPGVAECFQGANMHNISTLTLFEQNGTEPSLVLLVTPPKEVRRPSNISPKWLLCI